MQKEDKISQIKTEHEIRKFFIDSFAFTDRDFADRRDSITSFGTFIRRYYPDLKAANFDDPFIYALEEPYVDTTSLDTSIQWLRILVKPTFQKPYCLVLEKHQGRYFITSKFTNGRGGYNTGVLDFMLSVHVPDTIYVKTFSKLQQLKFWTLKEDTICRGGLDGETWVFEAIEKGHYNIVERWRPQGCGDSITRQLANIGFLLEDLSQIKKIVDEKRLSER